jgi:hypothetical protein
VVDERTLLAPADDAGMKQHAQMFGLVLLAGAGGSDELLP